MNPTEQFSRIWMKIREPVISVLIFFHVASLTLWVSPPFPLYWSILPPAKAYICLFGFWNQWKMFCHPKNWSLWLTATVTMDDGQKLIWNFPRMENLNYLTRMQKERYRKWAHEYVNEEQYRFVLPDACRFIARSLNHGRAKPVQVQLTRHWLWIQPPAGMGKKLAEGEQTYMFYTYDLKPGDLK